MNEIKFYMIKVWFNYYVIIYVKKKFNNFDCKCLIFCMNCDIKRDWFVFYVYVDNYWKRRLYDYIGL